jgi:hypothetical protein
MHLLIEYTSIKSFLWRAAERLSYIEDAWSLKVKHNYCSSMNHATSCVYVHRRT